LAKPWTENASELVPADGGGGVGRRMKSTVKIDHCDNYGDDGSCRYSGKNGWSGLEQRITAQGGQTVIQ